MGSCRGVGCPWCFLTAKHGDYEAAQHCYSRIISSPELRVRPHLAMAAWHAISDLMEESSDPAVAAVFPAVARPEYASGAMLHAAMHPNIIAATHTMQAASERFPWRTSSSGPSKRHRGQDTWMSSGASSSSATGTGRQQASLQSACGIPVERRSFQVWGGNKTKWLTYSEEAQTILRAASVNGEEARIRTDDGTEYIVNTDRRALTQVRAGRRPGEHCNKRRLRIGDSRGELEFDYGVD